MQIIGWMGCLYLVVKAFELWSLGKARRDERGLHDVPATIGAGLAVLGAFGFLVTINAQSAASDHLFGSASTPGSDPLGYEAEATMEEIAGEMEAATGEWDAELDSLESDPSTE